MLLFIKKEIIQKKTYSFEEINKNYLNSFGEKEFNKMIDERNAIKWFLTDKMLEENNFIEEIIKDKEENNFGGDFMRVYFIIYNIYKGTDNIITLNIKNIFNTITEIVNQEKIFNNKVIGYKSKKDKLVYIYKNNQIILENKFDIKQYYKNIYNEIKGSKEKYNLFLLNYKNFLESKINNNNN